MNDSTPSAAPTPRTAPGAIWSLVLGILGLICLGLLAGIPAVICGHKAQSRIRRSGGALEGEGLALGGLITGYISIALSAVMLPLMLAIAIPNFVKARQVAQTNACVNNLRMLDGAKRQWAVENQKPDDAQPSLVDLRPYIAGSQRISCPAGGVYTLNQVGEPTVCSIPDHALTE